MRNKDCWIEIDTRWQGDFAVIYCHTDANKSSKSIRDAAIYWNDFYRNPLSDNYKLLENANNGLDPLKCKKQNLSKFKKLLKLNKFKYKEDI